ncbi:hypothetical protein [Thiolapillus sp.]
MKLRTILIINTAIFSFACLAHVPLAIMSFLEVEGFEGISKTWSIVVATLDIALLLSSIIGLAREELQLKIIAVHSIVIALTAISIFIMVAKIAIFGIPKGNYSFGLGLTTALCAYSVYLGRRVYVEYRGGEIGKYHWYVAGIVGVSEVVMFSRFINSMFSA